MIKNKNKKQKIIKKMEIETPPQHQQQMTEMQQFETVKTNEVDVTNYEMWHRLATAQQDFNMIVNKETLTQMIRCMQMNANDQIKAFFEREFMSRKQIIAEVFAAKYKSMVNPNPNIQEMYESERQTNIALLREQEMITAQINELQMEEHRLAGEIAQLEHALNEIEQRNEETIHSYQAQIAKTIKEKEKKEEEIVKVTQLHNSIIDEYNKLQQALNKYRQAYNKVQMEIQQLKGQLF